MFKYLAACHWSLTGHFFAFACRSRNFSTLSGHTDLVLEVLKQQSVDEDYLAVVVAQYFPSSDSRWSHVPPPALLASDDSGVLDFRMWLGSAYGTTNTAVPMPHGGAFFVLKCSL